MKKKLFGHTAWFLSLIGVIVSLHSGNNFAAGWAMVAFFWGFLSLRHEQTIERLQDEIFRLHVLNSHMKDKG